MENYKNIKSYKKKKEKKERKTWRRNVDMGFIANQTITRSLGLQLNWGGYLHISMILSHNFVSGHISQITQKNSISSLLDSSSL